MTAPELPEGGGDGVHGCAGSKAGGLMLFVAIVVGSLDGVSSPAIAQTVREVFQKVAPSVVVIRGRVFLSRRTVRS